MDEPRRLVDDPNGSPLARSLLASARGDAPSAAGRVKVARRLGILAIVAAGTGLGTEAGALAVAGKLSAVIALGAVVGLAALQSPPPPPPEVAAQVRHEGRPIAEPRSQPPAPATIDEPRATPPPRATPAPRSIPAPRASAHTTHAASAPRAPAPVATPAVAEPAVAPVAEPEPAAPAPTAETPPPEPEAQVAEPAPQLVSPSRLAEQVALVDRARDRLAARDHVAALAALAEYRQRFPSGDLDAEADVVMIETLIAVGDAPRARALGAAFLTRFPRSPLAQRVRSLLERLPH